MFELEVLPARHGDCLLLHYGDAAKPLTMLIDGGPSKVFKSVLRKRIKQLISERSLTAPFVFERIMVSHMDQDHIKGILDMLFECDEAKADHQVPLVDVKGLWHNSFSDVIGGHSRQNDVEKAAVGVASVGRDEHALPLHRPAQVVLQSVGEGRKLRDLANKQHIPINQEFQGGLVVELPDAIEHHNLSMHFLCPGRQELDDLREEWDEQVRILLDKEADKVVRETAAARLDRSVFNLASMVVLVEAEGNRLLLTGDARGDHITEALVRADLLVDGVMEVDILKMPHHGSDRNVNVDFFRTVRARHYVFSGDGRHENPSVETLEMLFEARPEGSAYCIHWTYPIDDWKSDYPKARLQEVLANAADREVPFTTAVIEPGRSIRWKE